MHFTHRFIQKPVLASCMSLLLLLFGLYSLNELSIRQFPKINTTLITITTLYPGADPSLVESFITTPIEAAVASSEGIDYMTSSSTQGVSTVQLFIKLNFSPEIAFTDTMSKVQETLNKLPPAAQRPIISKSTDVSTALMYISLNSKHLSPQQITDYATRVIQPELQTVDGVAKTEILGSMTYAMRIYLNPVKMAALRVSPAEVANVLMQNNFLTAAGEAKGEYVAVNLSAQTDLNTAEAFQQLIIRDKENNVIRLRDVADVFLGSKDYNSSVSFNGKKAVFLAITPTSTANPLTVIDQVRKMLPNIKQDFPPSLEASIVYDATDFIRASIYNVIRTILEATLIVILVIFVFLGSPRSILIPVVTIPLSLIGVCTLMYFCNYSLNLLTLLAFVLAIGLVVDDAIVVVENIHRHIEEGLSPLQASLKGTQEIAMPIVSMTFTLAAVYTPIAFLQGITGALFKEFSFCLASSVIISGFIALTLSPMMCSKLLTKTPKVARNQANVIQKIDAWIANIHKPYQQLLHDLLEYRVWIVALVLIILLILPYLYAKTSKQTAPEEDQGFFLVVSTPPQSATLKYVETYTEPFNNIFKSFPERQTHFIVNTKQPISGMVLKPWDERKRSEAALKAPLQQALDKIAGLASYAIIPPALPGGGNGTPIQFIIKTTDDFASLYQVSTDFMNQAKKSGLFIYLDSSLKFNLPQVSLKIDRAMAADLGLTMQDIGQSLATALSDSYVNYFNFNNRSYEVIPQLGSQFRLTPDALDQIYVQTKDNKMAPLSTIVRPVSRVLPNALTHFQQMHAATIQGIMMPQYTLGTGIDYLMQLSEKVLPQGFTYDFGGQSRQFMQESFILIIIFFVALLVIYLILAAQYESFTDPLIILTSVPLSICGALIPLNLGMASINIYTQIGLITLIGLISKHGILIVEFANRLQQEKNLSKQAAVEEAASIRLRPILMTTSAMVFGVIPLLIAKGAGAVSRFDIGLVIASGLTIGTLFTLFVVPTIYTYLASDHRVKVITKPS